MSHEYIREFAELDNRADPDYIEAKGYVHVGHSQENLAASNMPSHEDIMALSQKLRLTNRQVLDAKAVLLVWPSLEPKLSQFKCLRLFVYFPEDLALRHRSSTFLSSDFILK